MSLIGALVPFTLLMVTAICTITQLAAWYSSVVALAIFLLAVCLPTVATTMSVPVATLGLHFDFLKQSFMLTVVVAAGAPALRATHPSSCKALAVHFNAVCLLAGTTSFALACSYLFP